MTTALDEEFATSEAPLSTFDERARFVAVNPAFSRVLGWTTRDLAGTALVEIVHPDERNALAKELAGLDGWVGAVHARARVRDKRGSYRWMAWTVWNAPGHDPGYCARIEDLDETVQAEIEKLRFFELSLDMLTIANTDAYFTRVNPAFMRILGWSEEDLLTHQFLDWVHPDDVQQTLQAIDQQSRGIDVIQFENRYRTRDGSYKWIAWTSSSDPQTGTLYAVARDITALKQAEAELHRAKEAAEASSRAKSEFLANMSHELRTPLHAILGYAQILERDRTLGTDQHARVEVIRKSGDHLLTLIRDILDLAKLDAGKFQLVISDFHLGAFLQTIVDMFELRARSSNIEFVADLAPDLPVAISCDETRLRQILINLLGNAMKFTERGRVVLRVSAPGLGLRFEVEDTGIGIPPSRLEAIFQPFEQLTARAGAVEGTGLGLAISKHLVEMLGSALEVESQEGRGTRFWFEIAPARLDIWNPDTRDMGVIDGYEGARKKLLIVDDKPENRAVLTDLLRPLGFEITTAADGLEALACAREETPDLIIMDLVMPKLDGFEAVRRMRKDESLARTPIVAASASVFESDRATSREAGCDAFLTKPIQADTLFDILERLLGLRWHHREVEPAQAAPHEPPAALPDDHAPFDRETLRSLYQASLIGDIRQVLVVLQEFGPADGSESDEEGLHATLHRLARSFRINELRSLLASLLSET